MYTKLFTPKLKIVKLIADCQKNELNARKSIAKLKPMQIKDAIKR